MTISPLTLQLNSTGLVSGQLYTPGPSAGSSGAKLVILLHGWGADGADLVPLAPALVAQDSSDAVFVPDAPYICSANPFGRQWFELTDPASGLGRNASACLHTSGLIAELLDSACAATGFTADQAVLGGFSQGGMVALTGGLAYDKALRGLFCLSGAWLTPDQPVHQPATLPVFLAHGGADPVVPADCMTKAETDLRVAGFQPQPLYREHMAHGIDQVTVEQLAAFISAL